MAGIGQLTTDVTGISQHPTLDTSYIIIIMMTSLFTIPEEQFSVVKIILTAESLSLVSLEHTQCTEGDVILEWVEMFSENTTLY